MLLLSTVITTEILWGVVAACIPLAAWILNKLYDAFMQNRTNRLKEAEELAKTDSALLHKIATQIELHEGRLTGGIQANERLGNELLALRNEVARISALANENKIRGEGLKEALVRVEALLSNLLPRLLKD